MSGRYDQAELLVALWKLGAHDETLPTSHGILDRALQTVKDKLPSELGALTFSTTAIGLRCYELPDILLAAQEALLTSEPYPTYLSTLITISHGEAQEIVLTHDVDLDEAERIGVELFAEAKRLKDDLATIGVSLTSHLAWPAVSRRLPPLSRQE